MSNSIAKRFQNVNRVTGLGEGLKGTKYEEKKYQATRLLPLYQEVHELYPHILKKNQLQDLIDCGTYLLMGETKEHEYKVVGSNWCRNRKLCPTCQWRYNVNMHVIADYVFHEFLKQYPDSILLFVTLTVKNVDGENLKETVDRMYRGYTRLTNKGRKHNKVKKLKDVFMGGCKVLEVTYSSKYGNFHPHLHCIFALDKSYFNNSKNYITKDEWIDMWQWAAELDYRPSIDVQRIKPKSEKVGDIESAVRETLKYTIKLYSLAKLPREEAIEVVKVFQEVLYHRQLISWSGEFRKIKAKCKYDIDNYSDRIEDSEIIRLVPFNWNWQAGVYIN